MKFTVQRSKWLRGGRNGNNRGVANSVLCQTRSPNHKCCLGFISEQLGCPIKYLKNKSGPSSLMSTIYYGNGSQSPKEDLDDLPGSFLRFFYKKRTGTYLSSINGTYEDRPRWVMKEWFKHAMSINDAKNISDEEREKQLKTLFKKHGHTIRFVD